LPTGQSVEAIFIMLTLARPSLCPKSLSAEKRLLHRLPGREKAMFSILDMGTTACTSDLFYLG
jgi:hypothetical protein